MPEKIMFKTKPDRGFVFTAIDLNDNDGNALIRVERNGELVREFNFPAYKVWNIPAHSNDIIESELAKNVEGYLEAGSTGLGGNVLSVNKENT